MSFAGLMLIGLVGMFVAAAVSRGHGRGVLLAAGAVVLLFLILIPVRLNYSHQSEHAQAAIAQQQAVQMHYAEMAAHGQPIPNTNLIEYTSQPDAVWFAASKFLVLGVLIGLPLLILAVVRRRSPGATGRPVAAIFAGVVGLFVLGAFFLVGVKEVRMQHVAAPATVWDAPVGVTHQTLIAAGQQSPHADEPHDDLWEEFTRPRIQLSSTATVTKNGDASAGHAEESVQELDHAAEAPPADTTASASAGNEHVAEAEAESHAAASPPTTAPAPVASVAQAEAPPRPRPEWVSDPLKFVDDGVARVVVQAGPYSTAKECYDSLRTEMRQAVQQRIEQLVRESTGSSYVYVPELEEMRLGNSFIDRNLLADRYVQMDSGSFGLTQSAWGLLKFTGTQDDQLVTAWKSYARLGGIKAATAISATVLAILGSIFALLKFDTWTRGYYTKRLLLGVPAAIIAVVAIIASMS